MTPHLTRRVPALLLTVVAFAAIVFTERTAPTTVAPLFAAVRAEWMPFAPPAGGLTQTWFCPGVPATGEDGVGGELVIANAGSTEISVDVTLLNDDGTTVKLVVTVAPHDRTLLDVDAALSGQIVSAVVEVAGGGAIVEQRAFHPAGTAVSPCANSTSSNWYLADGFTVGDSRNQIVLTNPYDDAVIVDVGFATVDGSRTPSRYQGYPIDGHSVKIIDLGVAGEGAQGEEVLAVKVESTRGQLIVGRLQHFTSGGRLGFTMSLAAPALGGQWWFAAGEKGSGIDERYSLFNPTGDDIAVDVVFLGTGADPLDPIVVPARQVVTFDPGEVTGLGEGRHASVFATLAEPSIVVERALTKIVDGQPSTSVVLGAVPRAEDGFVASTWTMAVGPTAPTEQALVVFNVDNSEGTVTVEAVGAGGPVSIPGLDAVPLPPAGLITIDLTDAATLDRQLIVRSTTRIMVERSLSAGEGLGRSGSWALPMSD
jgi:Family of unknown function (DUF5719)